MRWYRKVVRRCVGESGATFLEYAMLAAIIGIGVAAAVTFLGEELSALFKWIAQKIRELIS